MLPLYPPSFIVEWFNPPLRRSISPSYFFVAFVDSIQPFWSCALLCRRLCLCLLIASVLLSLSPLSGTCYHWFSLSAYCFDVAYVSADQGRRLNGFTQSFSPGSYLSFSLCRCKDISSTSLPGVLYRLTSPGVQCYFPDLWRSVNDIE